MYSICTVHVQYMYVYVQYMYVYVRICTVYVRICTVYVRICTSMYSICTYMYSICTVHVQYMYNMCTYNHSRISTRNTADTILLLRNFSSFLHYYINQTFVILPYTCNCLTKLIANKISCKKTKKLNFSKNFTNESEFY